MRLFLLLWIPVWAALYLACIRVFGTGLGLAAVVLIAALAPLFWTYSGEQAGAQDERETER